MSAKKKTIAVDIDDVIAQSAAGFVAFSNKQWGGTLTAEDYQEEWAPMWGVTIEEALRRAEEFHDLRAHDTFLRSEAAVPVLHKLAASYKLVAATSRRRIVRAGTEQWLSLNFPNIFADLYFLGAWEDSSSANITKRLQATKAELCLEIGASYLIDDQPKHCVGAAKVGVASLLFGDYGWNRHVDVLPANVIRVKDWPAVEEFFDEQG